MAASRWPALWATSCTRTTSAGPSTRSPRRCPPACPRPLCGTPSPTSPSGKSSSLSVRARHRRPLAASRHELSPRPPRGLPPAASALPAGVMESWRENKVVLEAEGQKHYMSGGKPGYFPSFDLLPHPVASSDPRPGAACPVSLLAALPAGPLPPLRPVRHLEARHRGEEGKGPPRRDQQRRAAPGPPRLSWRRSRRRLGAPPYRPPRHDRPLRLPLRGHGADPTPRALPIPPPPPTPPRGHSRLADASPRRAQVPGSVPFLKGVVPAYTGEVMAPFTQNIFTAPTAL